MVVPGPGSDRARLGRGHRPERPAPTSQSLEKQRPSPHLGIRGRGDESQSDVNVQHGHRTSFHEFLTELLDEGKIVFRRTGAARSALAAGRRGPGRGVQDPQPRRGRPAHRLRPRDRLCGRRASPAGELGPGQSRRAHDRPGETPEDAGLAADAVASPLRRSDLRYLPQVLRRARGLDPRTRWSNASAERPAHAGRFRESSPTSRKAPRPPAISAGTRGSCFCMPSG